MFGHITQVGNINSLVIATVNKSTQVSFDISYTENTKVCVFSYLIKGKQAEFWSTRLSEGDLITVIANAIFFEGPVSKWSVQNLHWDGSENIVGTDYYDVSLKGIINNLKLRSGAGTLSTFYNFGLGVRASYSKKNVFFNFSVSESDYKLNNLKNNEKVMIKAKVNQVTKKGVMYQNWYIDELINFGSKVQSLDETIKSTVTPKSKESPQLNNSSIGDVNPFNY